MPYVKTLIGRYAGSLQLLPKIAADQMIENGSAVLATETEIMSQGLAPEVPLTVTPEMTFAQGYKATHQHGVVVLVDPEGNELEQGFPNMAAARDASNTDAAQRASTAAKSKKDK